MIDIKEDDLTGDLVLSALDDLVFAESTKIHQRDLLMARKGEYRLAPLATVGIEDYLDDDNPDEMQRSIRISLKGDGMTVRKIAYKNDGQINIDAGY